MDPSESVGVNRLESVGEVMHGQESRNEARSDKSLAMFLAVFSYLLRTVNHAVRIHLYTTYR